MSHIVLPRERSNCLISESQQCSLVINVAQFTQLAQGVRQQLHFPSLADTQSPYRHPSLTRATGVAEGFTLF
jgi:hypothetical protein